MKNFFYKSTALIIVAILAVVWIVAVLCFGSGLIFPTARIAFIFGILSFVLSALSLVLLGQKGKGHDTEELNAVPAYYVISYLVLAAIFNGYAAIAGWYLSSEVALIVNVILIAIYCILFLLSLRYVVKVSGYNQAVSEKISHIQAFSTQIGTLIATAKDENVKKSLLELKQMVDYSNKASSTAVSETEMNFKNSLNQIQVLMQQENPDAVNAEIENAVRIWKTRNSIQTNQ